MKKFKKIKKAVVQNGQNKHKESKVWSHFCLHSAQQESFVLEI